ncbi:hypothetical protein [Arthrobacter zhaoguopingii]|uniref:hypothetical protein n=1 Tax=Arthrobacter zhaoguopingii TaxID=2681491 RepID=UPI00135B4366|nr:hypothetical protein [Arthrobacter zhaoguopingii]
MNKKMKLASAGAFVIAVFAGGLGVGSASADPTKSEEYAAVETEKAEQQTKLSEREEEIAELKGQRTELLGQLDEARAREGSLKTQEAAIKKRETAIGAAEAGLRKREDAVKGAESAKAATTIGEGTWTVGRNVEPGIYTTAKPVSGSCYWGIYTSGTNGDDIIANDIVTGGQPTVTLQVGQDFETTRCGSWSKIG